MDRKKNPLNKSNPLNNSEIKKPMRPRFPKEIIRHRPHKGPRKRELRIDKIVDEVE